MVLRDGLGVEALTHTGHWLGDSFLGGAFEEFVDEGLVRLVLLGGEVAQMCEKRRSDANGDEVFRAASFRAAHPAGAAKLLVCCFRDIHEVELAIRHRPYALCAWLGAR